MVECEERVRSERQNRDLKAIFLQHMKLLKSVRKILNDPDAIEGMEFVAQLPTFDRSIFSFNLSRTILEELSTSLHPMYQGTDVVMAPLSDNLSVALCTEAKYHGHEVVIETTSNTPLMRPAHEANEILWRYIANGDNPDIEKSFSLNLVSCELEAPLHAIVLASFRKYEDKNRVIFVGAGRWVVPSKCLQFEDQYWSIVEQSPVPTEYSSVVRTYNQLRAKETDVKFSRQHQVTQDILLKSIAKMSRRFMQSLKNTFMNEQS
ncbi:hypothetical protein PHMEG_0006271 [Phytophthora megakarya]|uniref:Uncharacterized protein n=1 Tax=Phytophthora megakarya TaxID=4795 RepID=A0A225WQC0_9STRA|nr:hypothetical protein PHMEG_0006271 [Phytophthora megakarya]